MDPTGEERSELLDAIAQLRIDLGRLAGEATSLRELFVPRTEQEQRRRTVRRYLAGTVILVLAGLIPLLWVVRTTSDTALQAQNANQDLLNDQYERALASFQGCQTRNGQQHHVILLIKALRDADTSTAAPGAQAQVKAFDGYLASAGPAVDCNVYQQQAAKLKKQGAV